MSAVLWVLWPLGDVHDGWVQTYPNILASILVGAVVWFWGLRPHLQRLHARHRELAAKHDQILGALREEPRGRSPQGSN